MNPCAHFEAVNDRPNCRIGEPVHQCCGVGCRAYLPGSERTPCEVWSRVMGYHRPVSAYNAGKQAEHAERVTFRERR
jgi:hypothetical protein